ncbi:MarR family transcriptional regulator [Kutzneria viridogrisea]|uniref:MarR family transcription regulator n=2 Tax=Kutzneria TaxID=43356 RepID=W5W3X4_9PSEU|nr:MarR family transcriptional regulator [Kutzneria albida]AHH95490.1 MarR family transcription regulator [Kutzneria albida DSM 43870]MBA8927151.1 DNA-binding MarR family transcriptional regulator [Kutzneria viridogrisea]
MTLADEDVAIRAQNWCTLAALHARIEDKLERALQGSHQLSVREYSVLTVLAQQDNFHLRMNQLASAVVLSQSATTRLVTRLEERGLLQRYLCADDRRGIYTEVTEAGQQMLEQARPVNDKALSEALAEAEQQPEFAPLVKALAALPQS